MKQPGNAPTEFPFFEEKDQFELWINQKIRERRSKLALQTEKISAEIITLPIVVHVIHNGESIGNGTNIPDQQIFSQIEVLNRDFRRQNPDTVNTPVVFRPVAADVEIQFELAKQDPEGLPTNGINRVAGTKPVYDFDDIEELSSLSYWPAEDYINIWVVNFSSGNLGIAQFPISGLEGLEDLFAVNRLTDGIMVGHRFFGTNDEQSFESLQSPFDKGRTTTHEMGHFLGLRHIWGDGNCDVDDFCEDTPLQSSSTSGCGEEKVTCGSLDMSDNYLDFTDDACMNLFTQCQKDRMRVVLENSPRRRTLSISAGLVDPVMVANNLGVRRILSPQRGECSGTILPRVELRNYGTNNVSNFVLSMELNDTLIQSLEISTELAPQELSTLDFNLLTLAPGNYDVTFYIAATNGGADAFTKNDTVNLNFHVTTTSQTPFQEFFTTLPEEWIVKNPDNEITWDLTAAPGNGFNNQGLFMNFFDYAESSAGELDLFISPTYNFTDVLFADLSFEYAYAQNPTSNYPEGLIVAVSTDCGNTFKESNYIFNRFGTELSTANDTDQPFVPGTTLDWQSETIDLNKFIGQQNVTVAFMAVNGSGNNLYIDDLQLRLEREFSLKLVNPPLVSCGNSIVPQIEFVNPNPSVLTSLEVSFTLDEGEEQNIVFADLNIPPGSLGSLNLPEILVEAGNHTLDVTILRINNNNFPLENNSVSFNFIVDDETAFVPFREDFEITTLLNSEWSTVSNDENLSWQLVSAEDGSTSNRAMLIEGFDNTETVERDWLISPLIDLSEILTASVFFDVSYANSSGFTDSLQVLLSTGCGQPFDQLLYSKSGITLAITEFEDAWFPATEDDWRREFIDLTLFRGLNEVRIAFLSSNEGGNNLFVDDIEFFLSNDENPPPVSSNDFIIFPNPASGKFSVAFNLMEKQDVLIEIYNTLGMKLTEQRLLNILNQTVPVDASNLRNGLYFFRVATPFFTRIKRVSIDQ